MTRRPDGFVFALKAPRFVTNRRDLATASDSIARFLDSGMLRLAGKLGPINWQLAPGKPFVAAEIEAFLALLPAKRDGIALRHAIEVRDASFAVPEFVQLARRHGVAIVLAGDAEYPQVADATAPFAYLRIMGTEDARKQGYTAAALTRWVTRARAIAAGETPAGISMVAPDAKPRDGCARSISLRHQRCQAPQSRGSPGAARTAAPARIAATTPHLLDAAPCEVDARYPISAGHPMPRCAHR